MKLYRYLDIWNISCILTQKRRFIFLLDQNQPRSPKAVDQLWRLQIDVEQVKNIKIFLPQVRRRSRGCRRSRSSREWDDEGDEWDRRKNILGKNI